jgi:DNA polymerase III gamma/tau subunit
MSGQTTSLIVKYRPISFQEIIGNELAVNALAEAVTSPSRPHAYIFTGPAGTGKTSLARIIGKEIDAFINEIDAASHSGVEDIRAIVQSCAYKPIITQPNVLHIIDEVHAVGSKQAWTALLKIIEEPPPWLYFALCTTETLKIPDTIKTRCYPCPLKPLKPTEISMLVECIAQLEGWTLTGDTLNGIVQAATGQPRKALTILQAGHNCQTKEELSKIIVEVESEENPVIALCKYLMSGARDWGMVQKLISEVEIDDDAIFQATRYLSGSMLKAKEEQAKRLWLMLEALTSSDGIDKKAQFVMGVSRILWGERV